MYHFNLTERLISLRKFSTSHVPTKDQAALPKSPSTPDPSLNNSNNTEVETENNEQGLIEHTASPGRVSDPLRTHVVHNQGQSVGQFVTRLPKLTLPTFSGNPLQFQTFWDSFEAAVHNNNSLTGVQKFHYLRSQLVGDASHVIANFPLTDLSYQHSVTAKTEIWAALQVN